MKRLWVLLLICLFPVHVFAAVLTYASSVASTNVEVAAPAGVVNVAPMSLDAARSAVADPVTDDAERSAIAMDDSGTADDDGSDGNLFADSGEDFSSHAGIGDEPILSHSLALLPQTSRPAPALRSDDASQPPFLPRAGRPPRA